MTPGDDVSARPRIDTGRLWDSLMRMARIGATGKGGVNRQALTDLDREARDLFISWCRNAGCAVRVDPTGNIFARRAGRNSGQRAGDGGQPSRHSAGRGQVRRRVRRARGAGGGAHPQRRRPCDRAADRGRGVDQRRGLPLRPFDDGFGSVRGPVRPEQGVSDHGRAWPKLRSRTGANRLSRW